MAQPPFHFKNFLKRKKQMSREKEDKTSELTTTQYLIETIKQLQVENENLKLEMKKLKGAPSGKIVLAFIIPGALALTFS